MVAHRQRMHHLMGDEDHRQAALARFQHDAQHMRRLLDAKCGSRLVEDQDPGTEMHGTRNGQRLALAARQTADQPVAIVDPGDAEFAHRLDRHRVGGAAVIDRERPEFAGRFLTHKE